MTELERKRDRAPVPSQWDYAPAPEARDLVELRERYGHFVGGEWLEPKETYATIDPSSEEPLAEVGQATKEEVDLAVRAAREAFTNGWYRTCTRSGQHGRAQARRDDTSVGAALL